MKMIIKIARMELQKMFYSPIAWLVLIVFAIQSGLTFMGYINSYVMSKELGGPLAELTASIFTSQSGFFAQMERNIYLYIPLLTMGLLSREFGSGSIKLLYSSPISNRQIAFGKFLSMMIFGFAMISILFLECFYGFFAIKDYDFPLVATGLLGVFLVICTYSAIGLFMSSLTSYQVVAAIGTFVTFFVLGQVGNMWQSIEFVRDVTYWLSINGRSYTFISGLICSEDLLYFILVSGLFITFTIFRLKGTREKSRPYVSFARYAGAFMVVALIGSVSTIPSLMKYYDSSYTKFNTLTQNSQDVISKLKGKITITTYVNIFDQSFYYGLPSVQKYDMAKYEQYRRFYPDMKFKYKYYYALPLGENALKYHQMRYQGLTTEETLEKVCKSYRLNPKRFKPGMDFLDEIDLKDEGNRFVRKVTSQDKKWCYLRLYDDVMRFPDESQNTAAFKKLVMELPMVGFVKGHEERGVNDFGSRGYFSLAKEKPFRHALINNGFDITECSLFTPVDKNIDILIIAGSKTMFSEGELKTLNDYIDRGGNLIIACDRKRQEFMNPLVERFGVKFMDGQVVEYNEGYTQDLVTAEFTPAGKELAYHFNNIALMESCITMDGAVGISYKDTGDFKVTPVLVSDTMKNMPASNDPEFLKQMEQAQKAKKEQAGKGISKVDPMIFEMLGGQIPQNNSNQTKEKYIGSWNELKTKDFIDDVAVFNPEQGEAGGAITMALALERKLGSKNQKIMILGDADCFSNGELSRGRARIKAQNFRMATGMFFWLSDGEVPVDIRRPGHPDNEIYTKESQLTFLNALYKIVMPTLLILVFLLIWLRRKSR